jgi:hypothetical protein
MAVTPNNNPGSNPNQLNEKQLEKLITLLQKIDELTEEGAINLASQLQSAGNAGKELSRLEKEWDNITSDISYGTVGFRDILELISNSNEGLKLSSKVYKGLTSLADLLQKYQRGSSNISEKEIIKQKELTESSKFQLETANDLLKSKNEELESREASNKKEEQSLLKAIEALKTRRDTYGISQKEESILQQNQERVKEIDREYQSIEKQINKNNTILERNNAIIKDYDALFKGLELTLQDIGQKIKFKNIENLDEKLKSTVKETLSTDENIVKINKSFNVLNGLAQKAYDHQNGITELSGKEIKSLVQKQEYEYKSLVNKEASLKKEQDSLQTQLNDNKALIVTTKNREEELTLLKESGKITKEQETELENIPTLLQKQNKISSELNEKLDTNKKLHKKIHETITDSSGALNALKNTLSKISKEDKIKSIENLDQHLKDIVENAHSTDKNLFRITKSFDVINSIAQKFEDHQSGANKLSEKEAKQLLDKLESERKRLSYRYESLKLEEQELKRNEEIQKGLVIAKQQEIDNLEAKSSLTKDEEENLKKLKVEYQGLTDQQNKITEDLEVNRVLQEKTLKFVNKQNEAYNTTVNNLKAAKKEAENMRKALGLSGLAVDGIGKALGKVGLGGLASIMGLDDAKDKMKEVADEITEGGKKAAGLGGQFQILIAGLKEVGASIFKNLTDPITIVTGLVAGLTAGIKGLISLFEQTSKFNGDIAKTFALSATESSKIGDNLRNAASSDFFMSNEEARQAFDAMANATGTINSAFSDGKTVSAMNDMMTYAGYTAEEAGEFYKLGQLNNKSADEMVTSLQGQLKVLQVNNKLRINEKQAVEMVAKASATVRMNLGANPKKLADAAFYASKLGMTLDEISSAAEQTLNFESAIQNQLEYQVLTGKEINIDAYQQAAASGDTAKAAEEMNRILNEQGDSIKGNFFAQESLAKTLGISREQLMKSLELQKVQKKVGGDIRDIEEAINNKMKKGLTFEQAAAEASKEGYESMVKQNQNAQVFSKTISEIKENFMNTIANSQEFKDLFKQENIDKYVKFITNDLMPAVTAVAKGFVGIIGTLKEFKEPIKWLLEHLGTISKVLLAIATVKVATNIVKGVGGLVSSIKDLASGKFGSPGSKNNPLYVTPTGGGGLDGGGMDMDGSGKSGKTMSRRQRNINRALKTGLGIAAAYTAYNALSGKNAEDFSQDEVQSYMQQTGIQDEGQAREQMASQQYQTGSKYGDLGIAGAEAISAASINTGKSVASTSPKPISQSKNQMSAYKAARAQGATATQALQQARQVKPEKGMFGKAFDFMSDMGSSVLKKTGLTDIAKQAKGFLQNPIVKGIGKALGPILSAVLGVMDIQAIISDAKMRSSAGEKVDTGKLGKRIIQSGADTVLKTILWAIPGVGQAIASADLALGWMGFSPLRWATDNLVDLIPDSAFKGLGDLAIGKQQQAQQVEDGSLNPNGGPVVSTFQKGELTPVMQGIKEDNVYMTTNKPVQQVSDGYYGRSSQDNSAVITAINKLTEVIMANSGKEIVMQMNGQTVGKVLTPIMTPGMVREINNTTVLV